jgi:hypothetical protein
VHVRHIFPYAVEEWWDAGLRELRASVFDAADDEHRAPAPLFKLLTSIFWRTEKADVRDELHIPAQRQVTVHLRLNPIERYFYDRLNEDCCEQTLSLLKKLCGQLPASTPISKLDHGSQRRVLEPFLHLRQACCHPHVAKGGHLLKSNLQDMNSVLHQMIQKTQVATAEHFRAMALAHNGLAGLAVLTENYDKAVEIYKWVIDKYDHFEKEGLFQIDRFQMLHALANITEVIEIAQASGSSADKGSSSSLTLVPEIPHFRHRAQALQERFTKRAEDNVVVSKHALDEGCVCVCLCERE